MEVRYVGIAAPVEPAGRKGAPVLRRVAFRVPVSHGMAKPKLEGPVFEEGEPTFPFEKKG